MNADIPHTVYLHRSLARRVLYVGCTNNLKSRTSLHKTARETESPWWPYVAAVEIDSLWPDRSSALERERNLIAELRPPGNRQHNPTGGYGDKYDCATIGRLLGLDIEAATDYVLRDGRRTVTIYAELMFADREGVSV